MRNVRVYIFILTLFFLASVMKAEASLTEFQTFIGEVGYSSDGFGSLSNSGTISAEVPAGSTVLAAYLYSSTFQTISTPTVELDGTQVIFGPRVPNSTACCSLASFRADVTDIVKPTIDSGPGGVYDFTIAETVLGSNTDGEALIVVYSNPSLPSATVGILDGFASVTGDTTSINFADPLDPSDPSFFAEMIVGIGFSCCTQWSTIEVNGSLLTEYAGNMDDADVQSANNGRLITVGSFDDPFSLSLPSYADDHERYDLVPFINFGDTTITIDTINASQDDNIFVALFYVAGEAGINEPPPVIRCSNELKAYVSNTGSDEVWVIDLDTATVEAVVPVGDDPRGIDITPDNGRVYVANRHGGTVSVIDTATNQVINTIDIEGSALVTKSDPYDVVVSPDSSRLYVAMKGSGSDGDGMGGVVVVDLPAGTIVAQIPFTIDGSPEGIVITPDGSKVYTSGRGPMHIVDTNTLAYLGISGLAERELVVSLDGAWVFADDNAVRTSDDTAFVTGDWSGERGITITPDGLTLFSTNEGSSVRVVSVTPGNPPTTTFVMDIDSGGQSQAYGIDLTDEGDRGVVSFRGSDTIRILDTSTMNFTGPVIPMQFDTGDGIINGYESKQLVISHSLLAISITTDTLPSASVGSDYSATLNATGGSPQNYQWSITRKTPSADLLADPDYDPSIIDEDHFFINEDTGELTWDPLPQITEGDTYYIDFTVRVTDGNCEDTATFRYTDPDAEMSSISSGGGASAKSCFIATAAYGSYLHPDVNVLKRFRDNYMLTNHLGTMFVKTYYKYSPSVADYIAKHETLRIATRIALTPLVYGIKYPVITLFVFGFIMISAGYKWRRQN